MSPSTPRPPIGSPLARVTSLKLKLGLLVSCSVLVAAVLATLGAETVPAWLSIPVTVVLALAVTQWLAIGMTAPLRQMTDAARRMAAGDLDVRVSTSSTDEVGELARAFSLMATDLAGVDRQRRELVASVSHELRTPLAALTAVLENLHDGVTRPDARTLTPALDQAQRLGVLVEDLLDLSRVDAGVVPLERRDVVLQSLLDSAVTEAGMAARAASRSVVLTTSVVPAGLTAYADPGRLHQVVANLLDNACRHSPPGGVVRVSARARGEGVRLVVGDDGPGIAPSEREHVFERFGTTPGSGGGTGLGLAIARWITDLHGGRIEIADPPDGGTGAHVRVDLPAAGAELAPLPEKSPRSPHVSTISPPVVPPSPPSRPTGGLADDVFGGWWRDTMPGRPRVLLACLVVGLLAAVSLPFASIGLGATLVLLASGGVVLWLSPRRREPYVLASAAICAGFAVVLTLRDALWIGTLGLLAATVLVPTALLGSRTVRGMVVAGLAWPLAGLRGLPWLGRCLRALSGADHTLALVRTAVLSLGAVLVFGLLLASADAVFGRWFDAVVPDLGSDLVLRIFTGVAVAGVVLAAAYLSLNPAPADVRDAVRRPARQRYEWLVPVLLVDAVFVVFLVAQAAAVFGGGDFVRRTTGLTYAEYVHQGFGQLTVATALTLLVVALVARQADLASAADRWWLRVSTGLLCGLTLVVVASALMRMALYTDAYGLTRLRLVVGLFEGWLGLVLLGVLVAGVRLRGRWLPRTALLSGAVLLLGLAVANPDALVARVNLDRYQQTGRVDWQYLQGLSDDAVPATTGLRDQDLACALPGESRSAEDGAWSAWNLGRSRADAVRAELRATGALPEATYAPGSELASSPCEE